MSTVLKTEDQAAFIEVELNGKVQLGVNARDLYKMLEVKAEFSHWIKRQIAQCKFEENFDYQVYVKKDNNLKGGRPTTEYIISVDMTKHLGMMERNEKGHEIRKYFMSAGLVCFPFTDKNRPASDSDWVIISTCTEIFAICACNPSLS